MKWEIEMDSSYKNETDIDEWGCATVWYDEERGVEYNFCKESYNGEVYDNSAIYPWEGMETDGSRFKSYKIDFTHLMWKEKLIGEMINYARELYD